MQITLTAVVRRWDYTVLLGNLLTGFAVTLNFFLMGLGVQKALGKDEKEAKKIIRLSQVYRYLILIVFLVIGVVFSCFNNWAVFVPVVFPRIAIAIRPLFNKKKGVQEVVGDVVPQESQEETKEQIQENTAQLEQQDVEE